MVDKALWSVADLLPRRADPYPRVRHPGVPSGAGAGVAGRVHARAALHSALHRPALRFHGRVPPGLHPRAGFPGGGLASGCARRFDRVGGLRALPQASRGEREQAHAVPPQPIVPEDEKSSTTNIRSK